MPRPPKHDGADELKFVTNYFLAGCSPPFQLVVDFSNEPNKDLLLLILAPDLDDIAQTILDPRKGRKRKPARHGKKRTKGPGIPDTSELIGAKARGVINPHNALNFKPLRRLFAIWNVYEGINFTAALIDGITDVGYETLWGILDVQTTHCYEFGRLARHSDVDQFSGGVGPVPQPVSAEIVDFSSQFVSTNWTCRCLTGPYSVSVSMELYNPSSTETVEMTVALARVGGGKLEQSYRASISPGGSASLNCSQDFDAGETCEWGLGSRNGFVRVTECSVLGYAQQNFPLPWN